MLFNSSNFLYFSISFFSIYYLLPKRYQNIFLLLSSYFFYASWDYRFLSLLLISTVVDYCCGIWIEKRPDRKKIFLYTSLAANLGILGLFKYFDFFIENLNSVLIYFGFSSSIKTLELIVPIGLSYYTFQTLSYTIDVYRGRMKPTRSILNFALFVAFFPQLVIGPIERARNLLPQIERPRVISPQMIRQGLWLILFGFFKKSFISDNCGLITDALIDPDTSFDGGMVLTASITFLFEAYGDFSGYTDIARGLAMLMGIKLIDNFRWPYFAKNPAELWQHWHMSLTSWVRDYLFSWLKKNVVMKDGVKTKFRIAILNLISMIVIGFWHGASWKFLIWGLYFGGLLVVHSNLAHYLPKSESKTWFVTRVFFTLVSTSIGWMIFRAESISHLIDLGRALIFDFNWTPHYSQILIKMVYYNLVLYTLLVFQFRKNTFFVHFNWHWSIRYSLYAYLLVCILLLGQFREREFWYYQF